MSHFIAIATLSSFHCLFSFEADFFRIRFVQVSLWVYGIGVWGVQPSLFDCGQALWVHFVPQSHPETEVVQEAFHHDPYAISFTNHFLEFKAHFENGFEASWYFS